MSIQVNPSSLIGLGIGAGDVAALVGLGKRIGNWYSAISGDDEFLSMLDEDEFNILPRRGLIDLPSFNKRWGKELRLFANGKPIAIRDKDAEKVLEPFSRFTAIMICVVTALDTFATSSTTRSILRNVLKELLRTSDRGEDLLATQYPHRLNSWRSVSCARGFLIEAGQVRRMLLEKGFILEGLMPAGESKSMEEFLLWLLLDQTDLFTTSSSDIAGFAACLSHLGMDTLSIDGLGSSPRDTSCRLIYSKSSIVSGHEISAQQSFSKIFNRELLTTVSLRHPEESVVHFPTTIDIHNQCRHAWKAGQRAASHVALGIVVPKTPSRAYFGDFEIPDDIRYSFINRGTEAQRVSGEMQELASAHAFVVNRELLDELQGCLGRNSVTTLTWLNLQTSRSDIRGDDVTDSRFCDDRIHVFSIFQSFFMGYYYNVFMRITDTSSLKKQTVEGNWGFRSTDFLLHMRHSFWKFGPETEGVARPTTVSRQTLLEALAMLFLNYPVRIASLENREELDRHGDWCIGVIAKKTILVNSTVNSCYYPGDIGRFVLLDVDVGGIPRDSQGLIRPGLQSSFSDIKMVDDCRTIPVISQLTETSPKEDASIHIEADWDADPDKMLLCARYQGRRLVTLSSAFADVQFCQSYVEPVEEPEPQPLAVGYSYTISNLIENREITLPHDHNIPMIVQFQGKPVLRYIAVGLFAQFSEVQLELASNCIHAAVRSGGNCQGTTPLVIIASQGTGCPVVPRGLSGPTSIVYPVEKAAV